jgi:hypothetical protein
MSVPAESNIGPNEPQAAGAGPPGEPGGCSRVVADALAALGHGARPRQIVEHLARAGVAISEEEATAIKRDLLARASVPPGPDQPPPRAKQSAPATEPAVERGERIETGKTIARGGASAGHVPGATAQGPA